jgi:pilus assembly protein CpaC
MYKRFVAVLIFALSGAHGQQPSANISGQVALKVRFVNVDRNAKTDLGLDLVSTAPFIDDSSIGAQTILNINQPVNIFLFRPDIDFPATLRALETRGALEVLAEPNVMAIDGKQASVVVGGSCPFPTVRVDGIRIEFREFGVRLNFLPNITPRGTIHLQVASEINSLDPAHTVTFQHFTMPTLTTRRVLTEMELNSGQSFVIGALLDNSTRENLGKFSKIPVLEKLGLIKGNAELLVIITPDIVSPIVAYPPPPTGLPELDSPLPPFSPVMPFPGSSPSPERRG